MHRSEAGLVHIGSIKSSNDESKLFDRMLFRKSESNNPSASFLANSIRLETEQEEKRLLQEQLREIEVLSNETNTKLFKQIESVKKKIFFS